MPLPLTIGTGRALLAARVPPPVNTVLPVISGTLNLGQLLSTTDGTWSNSPASYTYAWKRGGVAIGGATASTYTTVLADLGTTITVEVTATNAGGSTAATSAGVAIFNPATLAAVWFKADALALNNNDPVSTWTDSSANGRNATQATAGFRPLYKTNQQNSLPGVLFDGTDDYLATAAFTLNQPVTIFAVMKLVTSTAGVYMWDGSANNTCGIRQATAGHAKMNSGTDGPDLTLGAVNVHLVTSVYNGASSTAALDGGADVTGDVGANAMGQISLGVRGNKAGGWSNTMYCEFIACSGALSGANIGAYKTYLNAKYALF